MGNQTSTLVSGIDRKTLIEKTSDTPYIMNRILEELLKRHKLQDYTHLSSAGECKKYVVGLSATLDSIFYHINIVPQMDRDGIIYFRPIKDIVEQQSEKDKATRQSLCVILSYFYTRIFQIFGALALTLLDDATAISASGIYDVARGLHLAPGRGPYFGGGSNEDIMIGGADLGNFEFLEDYIVRDSYGSDEYKFRNKPMKIKFDKTSGWGSAKKGSLQVGLGSKGGKEYYFSVLITASEESSSYSSRNTIKIHISSNVKIESRSGSTSTNYSLPDDVKRDLKIDRIRDDRGKSKYVVSGEDYSAIEAFYDLVRDIARHLTDRGFVGETTYYDGTTGTKTYDTTGILEPLSISKTLTALQRDKPLGHCIARAIQLLDTRPIEGGNVLSYVCKSKFLQTTNPAHARGGIPEIGSSLSSSPGMYALSQLFFDVVRFGMTDVKMSESSLVQYEAFLKEMSKLVDTTPDAYPKKLDEVKNRKGCTVAEKDIIVKKESVPVILKKVSELYTVQLQHNANAMAILNQLFLIERDSARGIIRNIYINPNIFRKGIAEVERLNIATRNVLIKYYINCEKIYQEGAEIAKASAGVSKTSVMQGIMPGAKLSEMPGKKPEEKSTEVPGGLLRKIQSSVPGAIPETKQTKQVKWANSKP